MTRKERILKFVSKLPDDVSFDKVIYHIGVMAAVEVGEAQIARGEGIDHDTLFAELLGKNGQGKNNLVPKGKVGPRKNLGVSRETHFEERERS